MVQEYLPPLTVDEPSFVGYLMEAGIYYGVISVTKLHLPVNGQLHLL